VRHISLSPYPVPKHGSVQFGICAPHTKLQGVILHRTIYGQQYGLMTDVEPDAM